MRKKTNNQKNQKVMSQYHQVMMNHLRKAALKHLPSNLHRRLNNLLRVFQKLRYFQLKQYQAKKQLRIINHQKYKN